MNIIGKLFGKEPKEVEEVKEDIGEVVQLPEGEVNKVQVEYVPAPKPSQVYNPDSNEKGKSEKSFL